MEIGLIVVVMGSGGEWWYGEGGNGEWGMVGSGEWEDMERVLPVSSSIRQPRREMNMQG